ncbi:MAG: SDR family NAD(P)-dependent oxidoreductase [Burkholderiales bacterium]|nr:SDR family NAD(P)-dependent oxidoreductase [Burkholderiales bacterium]
MSEQTGLPRTDAALPAHAIAVVGLAGRFPGARDLDDFWRQVSEGVEVLEELTDADLDAAGVSAEQRNQAGYVRRGTFLEHCEEFDAGHFGYAPREAQVLDPQHRVFLECAAEALEHAGYAAGTSGLPESVGVYAGASMNTYLHGRIMLNPALAAAVGGYQLMLANDKDFLCTRVSYKLGLKGPSMTVQTACSTSLVAVQVACRALQRGECDMALAGGVSILFPQRSGYLHQEGMILSPDGRCRPFDEGAQGTRSSAGAGVVLLKRLDQALADGDTVHAVIRGIAVNNDGADKAGFTAPSVEGQVEVIATAQALAGVPARSVTYVEAHGTATPLGDPIEIEALTQAFRADTPDVAFCRLGSLKANLGHLDAAAGVAGLIKTVLALTHRTLPPLVNFTKPNPTLKLASSPFHASPEAAVWEPPAGVPRRAGVSSFGIGGTNAHAVLEEAPMPAPRATATGPHLLVWSARTEAALDAVGQRLAAHLEAHPEQDLADVVYTLKVGRQALAHRRAAVVQQREQGIAALREPQRSGVLAARHEGGARPVAFLFSGQGSQYAGMGRGLYEAEPAYREAVDRCAALLQPHLAMDIRELLFGAAQADAGPLHVTRITQPALFVTEYALARCLHTHGIEPAAMLGHSLGEFVAAHLAGVMSLGDALAVVAARGRLMQQQPAGRMAAVHLGANDVQRWLQPRVEVAAVNAPSLCTLSGPTQAIESLVARLQQAGIEARTLQTSHAFHSEMMAAAVPPFVALLERVELAPPARPFISNVTGTWITPAQATSPAYWAEHLRRPVLFEAGMRTLAADPTLQFLEVGPGQALTALARANLGAEGPRRAFASTRRPNESRPDAEFFLEATARLWLAGCRVGWHAPVQAGGDAGAPARRRVPLPTYPFERQRHAVEPASPVTAAGSGREKAAPAASIHRSARVDDWFYAPTWSRDDGIPARVGGVVGDAAERWLVLGDEGPLTSSLVDELTRRGRTVLRADAGERFETIGRDRWRVRVDSADDVQRLVGIASRTPLAGVVHLWGLRRAAAQEARRAAAAAAWPVLPHEPGYDGLVTLALALPDLPIEAPMRVLHATAAAESVLGEAAQGVTQALATGPVLVLPREIPGLQMRTVDLDASDLEPAAAERAASMLADETQHAAIEPQVAHRAGRRWVRRYERLALPAAAAGSAAPLPLRRRGAYLLTGGLGGMGLAIARWLGEQWAARLVLTSRRPMPPRETWDAWIASHPADDAQAQAMRAVRDIEARGGEVLLATADAADEAAMGNALAAARARFGELHGVFHAAGIAGRGSLARRSNAEEARAVFAPKVAGLQVLCRLLSREPLDLVVLVSSVNAVLPAPGACDYAAANAVFDAFVESTERPPTWQHVVAIDWGAWREVGMAARLTVPDELRAHWTAHLAGAIAPAMGIEALERVLASRRRRVVAETYDVVRQHELIRHPPAPALGDTARLVSPAPTGTADAAAAAGTAATPTRPTLSTAYVEPATEIERRLAAIWEDLLGVRGIGVNDDFFELGGHSLMFTRVLALIDEGFGAKLPLREVFDASTIRLLAERLPASAHAAVAPPADAPSREVLEI